MTPIEHICDHRCCADDGVHAHHETPDACPECVELEADENARFGPGLQARALRIAATKHPRIDQTDGDTQ